MRISIAGKKLTWIDIREPKAEDIRWLEKNYHLHPLVLKEILPPLDHPKIENFGNYLFLVLFYPFFNRKTFQTIPFELDIIVSKDYIITSHYQDIVPLKAIFDKCNLYKEDREEYTRDGTGELLYRIIQEIFLACFPKLGHIREHIDSIDKAVFQKHYKESVNEISLVKRDIIGFRRIVEPQKLVVKNLIKEAQNFFPKNLLPYFHNLSNLYDQVSELLENHQETLEDLFSTNQSLLTNRTNEIVQILTIFSVIVFPLNLLAAIFGMNTSYLPFIGSPYDFWEVCGIMMSGAIVMLIIFKVKKWI